MRQIPRQALSLLLSLALLCGLCVPTAFAAENRYSDTEGHWAESAIERWSAYGIVEGYDDRFNPDDSLTRGQMATVLSNALGLTETAENPFSDVLETDWYAPYVLRCYAAGVMVGDNGRANPNAEITRQEAMVMLCRALGIAPVEEPDLSAYTDSGKVDDWAAPYVAAMVESAIVAGIGDGQLGPDRDLTRASLMAILDRSVVQYINKSGTYELTNKDGIILVAAGDVILTGKTCANILVTPAADGKTLTFDKATATGSITVQADNAKIISKNSKLPDIIMTGEGSKVETSKPSSDGGDYTPPSGPSDLTVSTAGETVSSGTYQNVTITDAVGDGEVTLQSLTINGDLTVQGGGSNSIKLENCIVRGKVIMAKADGEAPRLYLTNTPIAQVEAQKAAIIEATDAASTVTAVEAKANVEVKGEQTTVAVVTVPAAVEAPVAVTVTAGTIAKVEAKSETTVTGAGSVSAVVAEAPVSVASETVEKVEVPAAAENVVVNVSGSAAIEIQADSDSTRIAADNAENITVSGDAADSVSNTTHTHAWGDGVVTKEPTCTEEGIKTYTCSTADCPIQTKTEPITKHPHTEAVDPAVAATCTEKGKTEGKHCSVCQTVIVAQEETPALGHSWGNWTADQNAGTHSRVCGTDSSHIETSDHTWDSGMVENPATLAKRAP